MVKRLLLFLALCSPAFGATLYVNKNSSCPGDGSTGTPYCTIQRAFDVANPDDHIKIRTGTGNYAETSLILSRSGTSGHPIIIEPDTANTPNIVGGSGSSAAGMTISASYVTVQNLSFDGTGVWSRYGILITPASSSGPSISNVTITGCTISNHGGSESQANDSTGEAGILARNRFGTQYTVSNYTISSNTLDGNRSYGAFLSGTLNYTFTGNTVTNVKRGVVGSQPIEVGLKLGSDTTAPAPANASTPGTVTDNTFHDFQGIASWTLTTTAQANILGIYADTAASEVTATGNSVYKLDESLTGSTCAASGQTGKCGTLHITGIQPESRCHNWIISKNVVYRVGGAAFENGSVAGSNVANNTQWTFNTAYKAGRFGFRIRGGSNLTFKNNIVFGTVAGSVDFQFDTLSEAQTYGPHTIDYNIWYNSASSTIASIADTATYNFANWKTELNTVGAVGKDAHSFNSDPLFTSVTSGSEDFHLQAGSPGHLTADNGNDMGAFPDSGSAPPTGAISQVTPANFTRWIIGESRNITWVTTGTVGNVDILLSSDSGATFPTTIVSNAASTDDATNTYTWTVTGPISSTSRVKVQDHASGTISDTNSADFRVGGVRAFLSAE